MTNSEFRELVANSSNAEVCENLTMYFEYATEAGRVNKTGLTTIYEFVKRERNAWKRNKEDLPTILKKSKDYFEQILTSIESIAKKRLNTNERNLKNDWQNIQNQVVQKKDVYSSNSVETEFLIDLHAKYPEAVSGAHSFFMSRNGSSLSLSSVTRTKFIGYLLAYEFELQDQTEIQQRRNKEKISLGRIRSDFEKHLEESEKHVQEITRGTLNNYQEHLKQIDNFETKKEELFDHWFANSQNEYQDFHSKMVSDADEMKELFRDGLRLAGPVKHWRRRALKMKKDGAFWIKWLGGSSALVAVSLFILLIFIPEGMTRSLFTGDPVAIKWAILYVTFVSFMVYAVRTFARLTFSSYHLARDAEEREQLTHVYLALKKDGSVEEKDRVLILQSLFSRAETGLLKDDSSPTLPGNSVLNKINGSN